MQFELKYGYWSFGIIIGSSISVFGKKRIRQVLVSLQSKELGALGMFPPPSGSHVAHLHVWHHTNSSFLLYAGKDGDKCMYALREKVGFPDILFCIQGNIENERRARSTAWDFRNIQQNFSGRSGGNDS